MKPQVVSLGLALGVVCAGAAQGQTAVCAARATIVEKLASEYGETRQAIGLASALQVVEIFASGETGSWTITVTGADGTTCLIAAGQNYEALAEEPVPAVGDPA